MLYICIHRNLYILQVHCFNKFSFVTKQLSSTLYFIGLDPNLYKRHSFRIGAATHTAGMGYSQNSILKIVDGIQTKFKSTLDQIVFTCEWSLMFMGFLKGLVEGLDLSFCCNRNNQKVSDSLLLISVPFSHRCIHDCR